MGVRIAALAGDGVVATFDSYILDNGEIIGGETLVQVFDGKGAAVGDAAMADGFGAAPTASVSGSFAVFRQVGVPREASLTVQWYGADGAATGDPVTIDSHQSEIAVYGGPNIPGFSALHADNSLAAIWHYRGTNFIGSNSPSYGYAAHATFDAEGNAIVGPEQIEEWAFGKPPPFSPYGPPGVLALHDGRSLAYTTTRTDEGRIPEFQALDENGLPDGDPVRIEYADIYPWAFLEGTAVLADGSIGLFLIDQLVKPGTNQSILVQVDETGALLREPVLFDLPYGPTAGRAPQFFPTQTGGFVAVGGQWGNEFQVFDRNGNALTDFSYLPIPASSSFAMMDNGRIAVVTHVQAEEGGDPSLSMDLLDIPATYTATPGGTIAFAQTWQDQLAIARGDGIDTVVTTDSFALAPFIPNLTMAGTADLNADGNDMANFLIGNDGDNILVGYLGNDVMHGHGGDDFLAMGRGNDVADGGEGDDTVWGGQGDDSVAGGAGDDILNGDRHDDVLDGGAGNDSINGGSHDDLLTGADGDDSITGGTGADTLEGWDGADTLRGDRDDDQLEGGGGPDSFVFAHFFGNDTVLDFEWVEDEADSDRIVIELDEDGTINGVLIQDGGDVLDLAEDTDAGVLVTIGAGHSILLAGWEKADLTEDAFALVVM